MTNIVMLPIHDVPAAQRVVNLMRYIGAEKHPVLTEVRRDVFYGGSVWVLYDDLHPGDLEPVPLSIHVTKLGKRKKNKWEPYANWYTAYTTPDHRRKGHATALYRAMETEAIAKGCRRVKSLAGSKAGALLHMSLGHQCWGETDNHELAYDTALPGSEALYGKEPPPQVPCDMPYSKATVNHIINANFSRELRYDRA